MPGAARRDPALYALLALVDTLRFGRARERSLAEKEIAHRLSVHVAAYVRDLVTVAAFNEALPGHLPPDRASHQRLPDLRRKLQAITVLVVDL